MFGENSLELPKLGEGGGGKSRSPTQIKGNHNITRKQFKEQKKMAAEIEAKKLRKIEKREKEKKERKEKEKEGGLP